MPWRSHSGLRRRLECSLASTRRGRRPRSILSRRSGSSSGRPAPPPHHGVNNHMNPLRRSILSFIFLALALAVVACSGGEASNTAGAGRGGGGRGGGAAAPVPVTVATVVQKP